MPETAQIPARLPVEPGRDCALCPRLTAYRLGNRDSFPDWHNAPVSSFGGPESWLLIVGLAPGLRGANRTGRPFTGDGAGELLYPTLLHFGLAEGVYQARLNDIQLLDCRVTNAVRCAPPENKPTPRESANCRPFLAAEMAAMPNLKAIIALGRVAHDGVLSALDLRKVATPFAHGALHSLPNGYVLADSYHCSRYNMNTRRLTEDMFHQVFLGVKNWDGTQTRSGRGPEPPLF